MTPIVRRRALRIVSLMVLAVLAVGLAAWMFAQPDLAEKISAIASMVVGLAAFAMALADYVDRDSTADERNPDAIADDLARTLTEQWTDESRVRGLRDPGLLPLKWTAVERIGDDRGTVRGLDPRLRIVRTSLDGHMSGRRLDEAAEALARDYQQLPKRRLVILGEPGSGKTVMAILLTLGVLAARAPGDPVPVLISASTWDPVTKSLDEWLIRALADLYYGGNERIPQLLVDNDKVIPVLDGLDEIDESARRGAVRAINQALGGERPIVVTCRAVEYADVISRGSPVLHGAPVVRILPVPPEQAADYLEEFGAQRDIDWSPVRACLREHPEAPLAQALSTPLMLSIACSVYERLDIPPADLTDPATASSRQDVEDYLLSRVIDAAYAPDRRLPGSGTSVDRTGYDAVRARRWLTFLARHLHEYRERDFAWWRLENRLLSPWVAPIIGIILGALAMTLVSVVTSGWPVIGRLVGRTDVGTNWDEAFVIVVWTGAVFSVVAIVVWFAGSGRRPGRLSLGGRGSRVRLRRGFRTGMLVAAVPIIPVLAVVAINLLRSGGLSMSGLSLVDLEMICFITAIAFTLILSVGLSLAVHTSLDAPPEQASQAGPHGSVVADRRSSLLGAVIAGLTAGLAAMPALAIGTLIGETGYEMLARRSFHVNGTVVEAAVEDMLDIDPMIVMAISAATATTFTILLLLTRAWARFCVARTVFALRGDMPLRLMRFLADARGRNLLRQTADTYQFRHIRLQEMLIAEQPDPQRSTVGKPWIVTRRRALALAGTTAILLVGLDRSRLPRDSARQVIFVPSTTNGGRWINVLGFSDDGNTLVAVTYFVGGSEADPDRRVHLWSMGGDATAHLIGDPFLLGPLGRSEEAVGVVAVRVDGRHTIRFGLTDGTVVRFGDDGELDGRETMPSSLDSSLQVLGAVPTAPAEDTSTSTLLWQHGRVPTAAQLSDRPEFLLSRGDVVGAADARGHLLAIRSDLDDFRGVGSPGPGVDLLHLTDGKWVFGPRIPSRNSVHPVAVNQVGDLVAIAAGVDIELWSIDSGHLRPTRSQVLHGHRATITSAVFSPRGNVLATGDQSGHIRLWNLSSSA